MIPELEVQDYKRIFYYFEEISKIPRGSGDVQRISDYLVEFAKEHKLSYVQDELLNVIITKEASEGYEHCDTVMIQGHMDMVCEKTLESTHDFTKDGLELIVEGEWLHANNTTLGGDDGIAVAYALALLSDPDLKSPRLEIVITTDEETGMYGATALDTSELSSKYMINVDSEDEASVLTSCAGGLTATTTLPITRTEVEGVKVKLAVGGLKGGHSGAEIHNNRSNATKLLGRLLFDLTISRDYDLVTMHGGHKDNVITRDAYAEVVVAKEELEDFNREVTRLATIYQAELKSSEPDLKVSTTTLEEGTFDALSKISFEKMLFILMQSPYGVQTMSADIPGLVETSLNLGIFNVEEDHVSFCFSVRSMKTSAKHAISDRLYYLSAFLGAEYEIRDEYPGWEFRRDSKLRDLYCKVYAELMNKEVKVEAIHAGLECGLIVEKMPDLDIISIGPDMHGIHTAEERLNIASSVRVYKVIEKMLADMIEM